MIKKKGSLKFKNPILIACWPGMGEVSLRAGLFLKDTLGFKNLAYIKNSGLFYPTGIIVNQGIIDLPEIREGEFYYLKTKNQDIILFLADVQPPLEKGYMMSQKIVEFAKSLKVKTIFTFAAMPAPIEHNQPNPVWIASTSKNLLAGFNTTNAKPLNEGQISGLNGLLVGVAKENNINGVCLLSEIPLYTIQIENPAASKAILEVCLKYLKINTNLSVFDEKAAYINKEIDKLIGYLKGEKPDAEAPLSEDDIEKIKKELSSLTQIPLSIETRIEELFKQARTNPKISSELKKLLDDWGLYKKYEDRFLDLFRKD